MGSGRGKDIDLFVFDRGLSSRPSFTTFPVAAASGRDGEPLIKKQRLILYIKIYLQHYIINASVLGIARK